MDRMTERRLGAAMLALARSEGHRPAGQQAKRAGVEPRKNTLRSHVLAYLRAHHSASVACIALALRVPAPNVSSALQDLSAAKLVQRKGGAGRSGVWVAEEFLAAEENQ